MKRIRIIFLLCLIFAVVVVASSQMKMKQPKENANHQQVTSREFKLLVNPEIFENRNTGYQDIWDCITSVANDMGVTVRQDTSPYQEEEGEVSYLDTQTNELYKQNYIFRKRIQYENGKPKSNCEFMLKYRSNDLNQAIASNVSSSHQFKAKEKLEQDVNMDGSRIGSLKDIFSHSNSIKIQAPVENSITDYAVIFPGIVDLSTDSKALLLPVNHITVHEYNISPGSLEFSSGLMAKIEISIWYIAGRKLPIIGEISFSYSLRNASSEAIAISENFFKALQKKLESKMVPGMTKTEFIYSSQWK